MRYSNFKKVYDFTMSSTICRRSFLSFYFDNAFSTCINNNEKCDICEVPRSSLSNFSRPIQFLKRNIEQSLSGFSNSQECQDSILNTSNLNKKSILNLVEAESRICGEAQKLKDCLEFVVKNRICVSCSYYRKKLIYHLNLSQLPKNCRIKFACFGCLQLGHSKSNCKDFADCKQELKIPNTYFCCKLPLNIGGSSFHPIDPNTKNPVMVDKCCYSY